jgi:DUF971 family protein
VTDSGAARTIPLAIRLLSKSRRLEIDWQDGRASSLTHRALRNSCRCSACVAQRRQGQEIDAPRHIALTRVVACGAGALQMTFSDGHGRGIYPFVYLASLAE